MGLLGFFVAGVLVVTGSASEAQFIRSSGTRGFPILNLIGPAIAHLAVRSIDFPSCSR
jgi:hypothetical protein